MVLVGTLLTGEQIRAARALGRIDQLELARRCGLSLETIRRLERVRGPVDANIRTLSDIVNAFLEIGIEFEGSEEGGFGMRMRAPAERPVPQRRRPSGPEPSARAQTVHRLVYYSTATARSDAELQALVADLGATGSARNAQCDITSALLACDGWFLQAIEGSRAAVIDLYGLLTTDRRHRDLCVIESSDTFQRRFPETPLCGRHLRPTDRRLPGGSVVSAGFNPEGLSPETALSLLEALCDRHPGDARSPIGGELRAPPRTARQHDSYQVKSTG
jgi:transcriptional regulator with XRE-family HTH domain